MRMYKLASPDTAAVILVLFIVFLLSIIAGAWQQIGDLVDNAGFWGTIIGAILGGSIAVFGQWLTIKEARQQRKEQKLLDDQAKATGLLFSMIEVRNNVTSINRTLQKNLVDLPKTRDIAGDHWQFYPPLLHFPSVITFPPEQLAVLLPLANADLFRECMNLDKMHNALFLTIKKANDLRSDFVSHLQPLEVKGDLVEGNIVFSVKQKAEIAVMNDLIQNALQQSDRLSTKSSKLLLSVVEVFRRELQLHIDVKI